MRRMREDALTHPKCRGPRRLLPRKTALLVVDMQHCLLDRRGAFGALWASLVPEEAHHYFERIDTTVVPNLALLLERCRALDSTVTFTALDSPREEQADLARWARRHGATLGRLVAAALDPPPASWLIRHDLRPERGEAVLVKSTCSAGRSTPLSTLLRERGVDTVLVAGVSTNGGVAQTAFELADAGFHSAIVEDACAALGSERHDSALAAFTPLRGWISTTSEVLAGLPYPLAEEGAA